MTLRHAFDCDLCGRKDCETPIHVVFIKDRNIRRCKMEMGMPDDHVHFSFDQFSICSDCAGRPLREIYEKLEKKE